METPGDPRPPRIPGFDDLVTLCRELNVRGARYVVIGGLAMAHQGLLRATEDVDLLIERSRENQRKVRQALECLPDKAVRELTDDDLDNFVVVRVADEIVVDLMLSACATNSIANGWKGNWVDHRSESGAEKGAGVVDRG